MKLQIKTNIHIHMKQDMDQTFKNKRHSMVNILLMSSQLTFRRLIRMLNPQVRSMTGKIYSKVIKSNILANIQIMSLMIRTIATRNKKDKMMAQVRKTFSNGPKIR